MSMYVPRFVRQRSINMNKSDLVITDHECHEYYEAFPNHEGIGMVLGFFCGDKFYDDFYKALSSYEAASEVILARVLWGGGYISEEVVTCLTVVSNANQN
jgi:hypothetical protein